MVTFVTRPGTTITYRHFGLVAVVVDQVALAAAVVAAAAVAAERKAS